METMLAHLALHWQIQPESEDEQDIMRRYHSILTCMLELGLDHPLDIDSELPHNVMSTAYLERFS